jgi:hypothetical protein
MSLDLNNFHKFTLQSYNPLPAGSDGDDASTGEEKGGGGGGGGSGSSSSVSCARAKPTLDLQPTRQATVRELQTGSA